MTGQHLQYPLKLSASDYSKMNLVAMGYCTYYIVLVYLIVLFLPVIGTDTWYAEFQRLRDTVPCVEVQRLREHTDQVLHISFSHAGDLCASCSKDCTVKVSIGDCILCAVATVGQAGPPFICLLSFL